MSESEKCWHAMVRGRVQGVFFREYTRRKAEELGLAGWVRNLADGRVETLFQGEASAVEAMGRWLRTGSPLSLVDGVEIEERSPDPDQRGFEIRYD